MLIGPQERQAGHQTIHITPCIRTSQGVVIYEYVVTILLSTVFLLTNVTSHLWGVTTVSSKWGTIKYSSMKSGVFPIALTSPCGELKVSPTFSMAQCMNKHPWTTAVTPCGWNLHALTANPRGAELTKSNSWWHYASYTHPICLDDQNQMKRSNI